MRNLSIDIETYSSVDLIKSGAYAYTDAPDFTILLLAYAFDDEEVQVVDFTQGETLPCDILSALTLDMIQKNAYNANFERTCIRKFFGMNLDPSQWQCTAVCASELGLPQSLGMVAQVLGLEEQKDTRGKALISYFCKPCKPTKVNGGRTRNLPEHDPDKWMEFKEYCRQDVVVEREVKRKISKFPLHESEQKLWELDQEINDRGVGIHKDLVINAIDFNKIYAQEIMGKIIAITGLENPKSVPQMKAWLSERMGEVIKSIDKEAMKQILKTSQDPVVCQVIELRGLSAKSSVSKYEAMERSVCKDGRIRGITQFYGANRTGRWAGRIVQPQNLPRNYLKDLEYARDTLIDTEYETFQLLYGDISRTLSGLIRTAIIPSKDRRFIVSDFSAIEARIIAYYAREQWRLDVFNSHGKIYEASAAQMFHVPIESIKKGDILRQKGKVAELALGYGGGKVALIDMGALEMGLEEDELQELVYTWRDANRKITAFWKVVEKGAKNAMKGVPSRIYGGISFERKSGILFIGLPSGRKLGYIKPEFGVNRFGSESITYMGMNEGKWVRLETWGGKLVENIIQAIARDCLAVSMIRLEEKGYEINFHVHDEVIIDAPIGFGSLKNVEEIMSLPISWAKDLPMRAEGFETPFYKKD